MSSSLLFSHYNYSSNLYIVTEPDFLSRNTVLIMSSTIFQSPPPRPHPIL